MRNGHWLFGDPSGARHGGRWPGRDNRSERRNDQSGGGYFSQAGVRERVQIEKGYALEVMPRLNEIFDLVFIDAVKEEYQGYLDLALPKLRTGGVVICDNLLWGGQVAGEIRRPIRKRLRKRCANSTSTSSIIHSCGQKFCLWAMGSVTA